MSILRFLAFLATALLAAFAVAIGGAIVTARWGIDHVRRRRAEVRSNRPDSSAFRERLGRSTATLTRHEALTPTLAVPRFAA